MTRRCLIIFCLLAFAGNLGAQEPPEEVVRRFVRYQLGEA